MSKAPVPVRLEIDKSAQDGGVTATDEDAPSSPTIRSWDELISFTRNIISTANRANFARGDVIKVIVNQPAPDDSSDSDAASVGSEDSIDPAGEAEMMSMLAPLEDIAPGNYNRLLEYMLNLAQKASKRKTKNHTLKAKLFAMEQRMAQLEVKLADTATKSDVEKKFADVATKSDVAKVKSEMVSDLEDVKSEFAHANAKVREEFQAKIDAINKRYDERLCKMGVICQRILTRLLQQCSAEELNDRELIQFLIDSLELISFMDESLRKSAATRSIFQSMQDRVSILLGYSNFQALRNQNYTKTGNYVPIIESMLKEGDNEGLFDKEDVFDAHNAAGYHLRECLSSKTFIQTIFEYGGTKNKLQEISSFLHEPPVKHLQRFLDILDKLEFEGEEAQQLRFILQTLILTGYKGKTALQPEPLSVENLVKGPDDVGSGGVRSPREFGVTSCPLELDIKSIQEIVRQPFHTSKSPSHSTTPSTYAAQDYRVQPGWQPTWQAQPPYSTSQFNAQSSPTEPFSSWRRSPLYGSPQAYASTSPNSTSLSSQALPSTSSGSPRQVFTSISMSSPISSPATSPVASRPASSPASPSLSRSNSGSNVHAQVFIPSTFRKPPAFNTGDQNPITHVSESNPRDSGVPPSAPNPSSSHGRPKPPTNAVASRSLIDPRNNPPIPRTLRNLQGGSRRNPRESEASQSPDTPTAQDRNPHDSQQASPEADSTESSPGHRHPRENNPRNIRNHRQPHEPKSRETQKPHDPLTPPDDKPASNSSERKRRPAK